MSTPMSLTMEEELTYVITRLQRTAKQLNEIPKKKEMEIIIKMCQLIDLQYKEFCKNIDAVLDTTGLYDSDVGPNSEFNIEAVDWHKISKELRKLG